MASTGIDGADAVPEPEKRDQIEMPNGVTSLAALGAAKVVAGCVDGSVHIFSAEGGQLERLAVFRPGRLHRVGCVRSVSIASLCVRAFVVGSAAASFHFVL